MSELQFKTIITNLVINQAMLVAILKVLGVKEKEMNKSGDFGAKTANQLLKNIKEAEKKNGK